MSTEKLACLNNAGGSTCYVVFVWVQKSWVLGGFATDKGYANLLSGVCDASNDVGDALWHNLAAGDVVGHEQALSANHDDVVDDHTD